MPKTTKFLCFKKIWLKRYFKKQFHAIGQVNLFFSDRISMTNLKERLKNILTIFLFWLNQKNVVAILFLKKQLFLFL